MKKLLSSWQLVSVGDVSIGGMDMRDFAEQYLLDIMRSRRSIRKYTGEEIPDEKLNNILKAGLLAPTSMDRRPCEFYVVKDKTTLDVLSSAKRAGAGLLRDAAAAIVVFADSDKADTWIEDSSIALSYMNLMAASQGIGSCWIQMHLRKAADGSDAEDNVREIMSVPDNYRVVGILSLGIPAEERPPHDIAALDCSKVHYGDARQHK